MKNLMKLFALLFVVVMVFSMAACQKTAEPVTEVEPTEEVIEETEVPAATEAPSTDPLEMITEGRYVHSYTAEGHGDFTYFFHFYKEIPVLGAAFYAGFMNNGATFAGTYTVEEAPFEAALYPDRESKVANAEMTQVTAPYTITFFDWDGNEIGKVGYDGDILYNVMEEGDVIYGPGSGTVFYEHDLEGKYQSVYDGEVGVPYLSFVGDEDKTSTLAINHNQTYADLVGAMIEGTWTAEETSEGGIDFTLVPNDSADTGAKVSVAADKKTCTYTADGGDPIAMSNDAFMGPQLAYVFQGVVTVEAYGIDADLFLNAYDDGTCQLVADVMGQAAVLDECTYELNGFTFNFNFNTATDTSSSVDASGTMTVPITIVGTQLGDIDTVLTLNKEEAAAERQIVHVFESVIKVESYGIDANLIMNLFDDNSLEVIADVMGKQAVMDEGTYVLDGYTFKFDFNVAEDASSEVDGTGTITVPFIITGTSLGDIDTILTRKAE